jgi:hypothetical protein
VVEIQDFGEHFGMESLEASRIMFDILTASAGMPSEDIHGDGTGARNSGNLRVTQHSLQTAKHQDEVTWLLTARVAMAEVAVVESDDARLRRQLVHLAGTIVGWIHDIDQRN